MEEVKQLLETRRNNLLAELDQVEIEVNKYGISLSQIDEEIFKLELKIRKYSFLKNTVNL